MQRHPFNRTATALLLALLAAGLVLQGCASRGGKTYSDDEVRTVQTMQYGTVVNVSDVMVAEDPSIIGPILGGVAGGVLGSLVGGGTGNTLAIVGGAAVGALAGGAGEYAVRKYEATELTIELENGNTIVVVQGNDEYFVSGDPVRVIMTGEDKVRVQHR